jgi:aconitate hydratase 2/2-methylisocitrate dehydratase
MEKAQQMHDGHYNSYAIAGARTEVPGCSLCMGNQARVRPNATVVSTSTRNFPNRLGKGANVFLASAELAAVASILGKLPTREEYLKYTKSLDPLASDIYRYLNFNELSEYTESAAQAAKRPGALPILQ